MEEAKFDNNIKQKVNEKHIEMYQEALSVVEFLLNECAKDIKNADIDYLDIPKNTVSTIDFLISSIGKIQKGQRLALGLDDDILVNDEPEINIVEGLSEDKI